MKHVKLIAKTEWNNQPEDSSAEDIISYCARVSNPKNQENFSSSEKLLKYCISHKHWSVFEMSNLVFEVNTTRDIGRQILRHRSCHFQEFSQRYADPSAEGLGFTIRECRLQDAKNRQNSLQTDDEELAKIWEQKQQEVLDLTQSVYMWAIDNGLAKEQARAVLPEGLTKSRMYINGTMRSWITYVAIREDISTQKEHRLIAKEIKSTLIDEFPFLGSALGNVTEQWKL